MTGTVLEVSDLRKSFAGVTALDGVTFEVREREILAILGPNGSGKTTLFNVISGFMAPTAGSITLFGHPAAGRSPRALVNSGLARSFQQSMAFRSFSVRENLAVAQLGLAKPTRRRARALQSDLLELCGLSEVSDRASGSLPYGYQRKLGVAIALATDPKLVLLDEPAAGLSDDDMEELAGVIQSLPARGISVACIDHNLAFLLPVSHRVLVLDAGTKIFEGSPAGARNSQAVIDAYLGSHHEH